MPRSVSGLPAPIGIAATFSPELARRYGQILAREARALSQRALLIPESGTLGEDPLLAAALVAEEVRGIRSEGLTAIITPFPPDIAADERTLQELYLPPFQAALNAGARAITAGDSGALSTAAPPLQAGSAKVARELITAGAVLLKNEKDLLPLSRKDLESVVVIGGERSAAASFLAALASRNPGKSPLFAEKPAEALAGAKKAKTAVIFACDESSEGGDSASLSLPSDQDALIAAVAAVNPRTIVVLSTRSCITMPWLPRVPAVMEIWHPGQEGGEAAAALLLGEAEPGGRLPLTFPLRQADMPASGPDRLFVGYRHYDKRNIMPLFPFGHGLGYTRFQLSSLNVSHGQLRFVVTNTGKRAGTVIPQVYVGPTVNPPVPLEEKKLVAFTRVVLKPGESRVLNLVIPDEALSYWSLTEHKWILLSDERQVYVGFSSRVLPLSASMDG